MSRAGRVLVLCSVVLVAGIPPATAHSIDQPLSVETQLLRDEGEDAFYWYDGFDLWTLFAREAYLDELGSTGVIFRFKLYGGFSPLNATERLHVDLGIEGPDGSRSFRFTTPNNVAWGAENITILSTNVTADDPPWTGVTATIRAFASYEQLDVRPGQDLSGVRMASYADDDLLDVAPGGIFVPHTGGAAEVPSSELPVHESRRVTDPWTLEGPTGYVDVDAEATGGNVTFQVESRLESQAQHVVLAPARTSGWTWEARGPGAVPLPAENATTMVLDVEPSPRAEDPLRVEILTDVGGREPFYVGVSDGDLTVASDPAEVPVDPAPAAAPATPAPSAWGVLVGLVAAVLLVRRDR